ncbi:MAG: hypothetical protein WBP45_00195 [Daejeonella sp.]
MKNRLFLFLIIMLPLLSYSQEKTPYGDWKENSISNYQGRYINVVFQNNSAEYMVKEITIQIKNDKTTASYNCYSTKARAADSLAKQLNNPCIKGNLFRADTLKNEKFLYTPKTLKGKFVFQYPPNNAKGPVQKGLLLGEELYIKSE